MLQRSLRHIGNQKDLKQALGAHLDNAPINVNKPEGKKG